MSNSFTFPPPPPPPPSKPHHADFPNPSHQHNGFPRARGGGPRGRGRGRGSSHRGGFSSERSGGHAVPPHVSGGLHAQRPMMGNANGYAPQGAFPSMYPQESFPHQAPFPSNFPSSGFQSYPQPSFGMNAMPVQPSGYHPNMGYGQNYAPGFTAVSPMGQPLRMGFGFDQNEHPASSNGFRKPAKKPKVDVAPAIPAFGTSLPAKPPAPASESTEPSKDGSKSYKRTRRGQRRRPNQLGLTPAGEDYESSSDEEEDVDEEAAFAAKGEILRIEHKGRVHVLDSAAALKSWIAERKKHFPTEDKVQEKKLAIEKKRKERQEQHEKRRKEQFEQRQIERAEARKKVEESREKQRLAKEAKQQADKATGTDDVSTAKSELDQQLKKVEKLREKLKKSEEKAAKAVAAAAALKTTASSTSHITIEQADGGMQDARAGTQEMDIGQEPPLNEVDDNVKIKMQDKNGPFPNNVAGPPTGHVPTDVDTMIEETIAQSNHSRPKPEPKSEVGPGADDPNSDTESTTSASSSTSSNPSSTTSNIPKTSAPDELSSKPTGPIRIPPPKREKPRIPKQCRNFAATGRCIQGDRCRFLHEKPEQAAGLDASAGKAATKRRNQRRTTKKLFDRLVEKEVEQENRRVLEAIKVLGERGVFAGAGTGGDGKVEEVAKDAEGRV
ncbi:MAG: hypothetical protein M1828_006311 [Chrysothrix sp. TS-e1954]|nr:MAG: hypothetical protein M1828_006311 [Chrysothrix sp. TS-e1954]